MARSSREKAPGGASRAALLRAARELMVERGSGHVSIRDIARRAGVNLSQIYYYFGSKEALRSAVLFDAVAEFDPTQSAVPPGLRGQGDGSRARRANGAGIPSGAGGAVPAATAGARSEIESIMAAVQERLAEVPVMHKLLLRELSMEGPGLRRLAEDLFLPRLHRLQAVLRRGQRNGTVRRGDAKVQAVSCIALSLFWFLAQPILGRARLDALSPSVRRRIRSEVFSILEHGIFRGRRRGRARGETS